MKNYLAILLLLVMGSIAWAQAAKPAPAQPVIDIVFCIDCSGSMGGVIETAKQKVWAIVNEVARVKPSPVLRIGLYGYGNADGPFRRFDLTDDLDEVYKNLMTFKDEGWGSEYVGLVIQRATEEQKWAAGDKAMKVIYVVGNETAKQGAVDYTSSAPTAIGRGIVINAIYCGDTDYQAATPTWREIAKLADGQYMEIAGQGGAVIVKAPQDDELARLNGLLNATYVSYGAAGAAGVANQMAQDANSRARGGGGAVGGAVLAERAIAKSSAVYSNGRWDLVDASKAADFDLSKIKEEDLPEEMRKMTPEQRKEFIEAKTKERADIQNKIKDLAAQRGQYLQEELKRQGLSQDQALDNAVKASISELARKKGFELEK